MSKKHPIIAVTGSSGAGTSSVKTAFEHIFRRQGYNAAVIQGDGFHRYDREQMDKTVEDAARDGRHITHFGVEGNLFDELDELFKGYAKNGSGKRRFYVHNETDGAVHGYPPGAFTPWEALPKNTDLLFYEGLHGGLVTGDYDFAGYVDLLIGVTPIINLEWIQKIYRDKDVRGYTAEDATMMILDRMHDYVHYITPQFSRTDINFQRVPTVDTANPFGAVQIPTSDESFTVIHIRNREKFNTDFHYLLEMLNGSFMSTPYTIVVPAGKTDFAMQLIMDPIVKALVEQRGADAVADH
ncbi:MAG: phosphoribulokinase [Gammaproteobacteria bacterium]